MASRANIEQLKSRLLFPGTTLVIGLVAFAVGYRTPGSALPDAPKFEHAGATKVVPQQQPVLANDSSSAAVLRENLQVEGFAKIDFSETEEVLTAASPEQRKEWAQQLAALPDKPQKVIAFVAFYTGWLQVKPDEAIQSLREFPDVLSRFRVFSMLEAAAPPAILPQLVDVVSGLSEAERNALLPGYFASLADVDPAASAAFIESHPKLVSSADASTLISAWAGDDINGARKWLEGSRFSDDSTALRSLIDSWLAKNPAAARDYVLLHLQSDGITAAASSVASHLFNNSPDEAGAFVSSFDGGRAAQVAGTLALSADDSRPGDMVAWVSSLPASPREAVLPYILARWISSDPAQAIEWLREKPPTERESLVINMINHDVAPSSPELVSMAYKIRDATNRDKSLSVLVQSYGEDEGGAAEQIRALGLPASQTNHLLRLRAAVPK